MNRYHFATVMNPDANSAKVVTDCIMEFGSDDTAKKAARRMAREFASSTAKAHAFKEVPPTAVCLCKMSGGVIVSKVGRF